MRRSANLSLCHWQRFWTWPRCPPGGPVSGLPVLLRGYDKVACPPEPHAQGSPVCPEPNVAGSSHSRSDFDLHPTVLAALLIGITHRRRPSRWIWTRSATSNTCGMLWLIRMMGLAHALCSACAAIDFEMAMIDGWMPDNVRSDLIKAPGSNSTRSISRASRGLSCARGQSDLTHAPWVPLVFHCRTGIWSTVPQS